MLDLFATAAGIGLLQVSLPL